MLDPVALTRAGADWNEFNDAVGDATWILHDSLMDLPGFAEIGLKPKALFDTEIAARLLGLHRFGLAAVTEHYLGITLAKEPPIGPTVRCRATGATMRRSTWRCLSNLKP